MPQQQLVLARSRGASSSSSTRSASAPHAASAAPAPGQVLPGGAPRSSFHDHHRRRRRRRHVVVTSATPSSKQVSSAEKLSAELEQLAAVEGDPGDDIGVQLAKLREQASQVQSQLDEAYSRAFGGLQYERTKTNGGEEPELETVTCPAGFSEADFVALGRGDPEAARSLLSAKAKEEEESSSSSSSSSSSLSWQAFQSKAASLKSTRSRIEREASSLEGAYEAALARRRAEERRRGDDDDVAAAAAAAAAAESSSSSSTSSSSSAALSSSRVVRPLKHGPRSIVLVAGFESFNARLYEVAAADARRLRPGLRVSVFCDADIAGPRSSELAEALGDADAVFCSLVFDYDQVEWLRARLPRDEGGGGGGGGGGGDGDGDGDAGEEKKRVRRKRSGVRLAFESALELMAETRLGSFKMDPSGRSRGPPPAVKKVLSLFGSGREEDRLAGYLSLLKVGPALLKFLPGKAAADVRRWLTVYSYWNAGGRQNVTSMLLYLADEVLDVAPGGGGEAGVSGNEGGGGGKPSSSSSSSSPLDAISSFASRLFRGGSDTSSSSSPALAPPPPLLVAEPAPVVETPATGCIHPSRPGHYFEGPRDYLRWYASSGRAAAAPPGAPVVAVLLYRKHVITSQPYLPDLIDEMERGGLVPVPIFINGVEAHTVVRDLLTSDAEIESEKKKTSLFGGLTFSTTSTSSSSSSPSTLESEFSSYTSANQKVRVDAVVSTIGFPLVGGPAGTMEGGRQADVAREILSSKDVPYFVAAPLLIQDIRNWSKDGVTGLQSVVLYSLPELDGAVDALPLGGLVNGDIFLVRERVSRLAARVRAWCALRRARPEERRVAAVVYGFPPGVGATGTAALLDVPKSIDAMVSAMDGAGYDLGPRSLAAAARRRRREKKEEEGNVVDIGVGVGVDVDDVEKEANDDKWTGVGQAVIDALAAQLQPRALSRGAAGVLASGSVGTPQSKTSAAHFGAAAAADDVPPSLLRDWLSFPREWGPTEWGPIPFLPPNDILVRRMESNWGELGRQASASSSSSSSSSSGSLLPTSGSGTPVAAGVELGNLRFAVQPALGIEGDPMRLLFDRDLTPHPSYAAFYLHLQREFRAHALVHLGMHGTVEWLPGSPLGSTALSWPDVLLGSLPNAYVYAANNPSESIVAKRRGFGTLVSYNVPPYGRSGLYKQLQSLAGALAEWREVSGNGEGDDVEEEEEESFSSSAGKGEEEEGKKKKEESDAAAAAAERAARGAVAALVASSGLYKDCPLFVPEASSTSPPTPEDFERLSRDEFAAYASRLSRYLRELEARLFSEGLHVLGKKPGEREMTSYLEAYYGVDDGDDGEKHEGSRGKEKKIKMTREAIAEIVAGRGVEAARAALERSLALSSPTTATTSENENENENESNVKGDSDKQQRSPLDLASEAESIRSLLLQTPDELSGLLRVLDGRYLPAAPGGDLLRDGAGVLPTGRNIYSLDPFRMPSPAAVARGARAADAILAAHSAANPSSPYPETVAVNLWGLDAIKTRGESVGVVLRLVGARVVTEGTGRVARFELVPLEELTPPGRPRVDVLCNVSGIFRDSFRNVLDLLDALFEAAATAEGEGEELNFVKKHARECARDGIERPSSRLFSNPAGDYGSMVGERVGAGNWDSGAELGATWVARNAFSFGRSSSGGVGGGIDGVAEAGQARPELLEALLSTTERVVQTVDSVEYGLTDINEYYANTGALARAAGDARARRRRRKERQGKESDGDDDDEKSSSSSSSSLMPAVSIVEAFGDAAPKDLDAVLRLEYRSKLLNPKWAKAMANAGSGGAFEIGQRMTAMLGWGATSGFKESWTWQQAAETYVLDEEMAEVLKKNNPEAFRNVVGRMLEAAGRGIWEGADEALLERLREAYSDVEDRIEGVA